MKLRMSHKNHLILAKSLGAGARLPTTNRFSRYFLSQWSNIGQQSSGESVLCGFGTIYGVRAHGI